MHHPELAKVSCRRGPRTGAAGHLLTVTAPVQMTASDLKRPVTSVASTAYARVAYLESKASELFLRVMDVALPDQRRAWAGLQPMCADGVPLLGPTRVSNVFLCTGHGHLRWTLAAGSGDVVASAVLGDREAISGAPYALSRFGH